MLCWPLEATTRVPGYQTKASHRAVSGARPNRAAGAVRGCGHAEGRRHGEGRRDVEGRGDAEGCRQAFCSCTPCHTNEIHLIKQIGRN